MSVITSEVTVLAPVCDKFAASLKFASPYHGGNEKSAEQLLAKHQMHEHVVEALMSLSKAVNSYSFSSKIYQHSFSFETGGSTAGRLIVQAAPKYLDVGFLRVEWNPRKADAGIVIALLNQIVPDGYVGLFATGVCTRFDVAVDLVGVDIEQLLVWSTHLRATRVFCRNGRLETYYLGAKSGRTMFVVYDRVAAGLDPGQTSSSPITRIEGRFRKRFKLTGATTNPGMLFHRVSVSNFPTVGSDPFFGCFQESCRFRGPLGALQRLEPKQRKNMEKRLTMYATPWWNPQLIAQAVPGLLKSLRDGYPTSN